MVTATVYGDPDAKIDEFLAAALADERDTAHAMTMDLAEARGPSAAVAALLGPAQITVGERWVDALLHHTDEHRVSVTVDDLLFELDGWLPAPATGPVAVIGTGVGDRHVTAARMGALLLRARGWRTRLLGGSLDEAKLQDAAEVAPFEVVVISCSSVPRLIGVARSIAAAHRLGFPVVVGGGAFTGAPEWAERLGADAGPATLPDGGAGLAAWAAQTRQALALPSARVAAVVELDPRVIVAGVREQFGSGPPFEGPIHVANLLEPMVEAWRSAIAVDDRDVLGEQLTWARRYCRARELPEGLVAQIADALLAVVRIDVHGALADASQG